MKKINDSILSPERWMAVRKEADRALRNAGAFGVFPTPVPDVMEMANVILAPEDAFSEGLINKFRQKFKETLKKALSKVQGVFDSTSRIIYIDKTLLAVKQTFLKLHETAHSFLPWQQKLYSAVEDCEKTIESDLADEFDCEANIFASEVLFQCETFTNEAADYTFGISTPLKLSKKYGASVYATVRRYVSTNPRPCAVVVLNMPEFVPGDGFVATLRRVEISGTFLKQFGAITWPEKFTPEDSIGTMIPMMPRRMSKPRQIVIADANGIEHECIAEAFTSGYQVFVLICPSNKLTKKSIIVPNQFI